MRLLFTVLLGLLLSVPQVSAGVEKIFFSTNRNGNFDIYMMNPDGTSVEPVVTRSGDQTGMQVSPDGRELSYFDSVGPKFVVRNLATGAETTVANFSPRYHSWFPDGSGWLLADPWDCTLGAIYKVSRNGSKTLLIPAENTRQTTWGMYGNRVIYTTDPCNSPDVVIKSRDLPSGSSVVIQDDDNRAEDGGANVRSDGRIAFSKADVSYYGMHRIWTMNVDGSGANSITSPSTTSGDWNPSWSPDGSRVVFCRAVSNSSADIYSIGASGNDERRLLAGNGTLNYGPVWANVVLNNAQPCAGSSTVMCLNNSRFSVSVTWRTSQGTAGSGQAVKYTPDSGLFWFFAPDNIEMLVKVLNGCALNGRYWVFSAGITDVEYTLTVTDTAAGIPRTYFHAMGSPAPATTDTDAFSTCNATGRLAE